MIVLDSTYIIHNNTIVWYINLFHMLLVFVQDMHAYKKTLCVFECMCVYINICACMCMHACLCVQCLHNNIILLAQSDQPLYSTKTSAECNYTKNSHQHILDQKNKEQYFLEQHK